MGRAFQQTLVKTKNREADRINYRGQQKQKLPRGARFIARYERESWSALMRSINARADSHRRWGITPSESSNDATIDNDAETQSCWRWIDMLIYYFVLFALFVRRMDVSIYSDSIVDESHDISAFFFRSFAQCSLLLFFIRYTRARARVCKIAAED